MNVASTICIWLLLYSALLGQRLKLEFESSQPLPNVQIDGKAVHIHTQGLFVSAEHLLVTGRLESAPKRAVLVRFLRTDVETYEIFDITPPQVGEALLDHPGGFDIDSAGRFWIPLSTSHSRGPTQIRGYQVHPEHLLSEATCTATIELDDHIGAICVLADDTLVGANWDTKMVYRWDKAGKLISSVARDKLLSHAHDWQVAVQDWKRFASERNLALLGGIDKTQRPARAVVQVLDFDAGRVVNSRFLPSRADVSRPLSNEGMAMFGDRLFLLPEDLGRGAKLLQFRLSQ